MKFPSGYTSVRKEDWAHAELGSRRVAIICKTMGLYGVIAVIPKAWRQWLVRILNDKLEKQ